MERKSALLFAVGAGLSLVDAAFTLGLRGTFEEVNPVLRPLLAVPALFLLAKLALTLAGMGSLARLDARAARGLLVLVVGAYGSLDGYWIVHTLAARDSRARPPSATLRVADLAVGEGASR
jgi:Domain of unknown function (DUF5658)